MGDSEIVTHLKDFDNQAKNLKMEIMKKNSNFMRLKRATNKTVEVNYGNASEILNMKSNLNFNCEFEGCRELGSLHASL